MNAFQSVVNKVENAPKLDFGNILSSSIDLFKKVWVQGLVMLLLTVAFMIPFYIITYVPLIVMGVLDEAALRSNDFNPVFLIPFYILLVVLMLFVVVIDAGLKASFFRICKQKDFNEASADDYFYFFKKTYLLKTIKLGLASFGIVILAMMLCVIPVFYVAVPLTLINVVYAFNPELSISEIVKVSFKLGNKKWFITFGLIFVAGLMAEVVGFMLCFVGLFVTASFSYLPAYFIYKETIGFNEEINGLEKNELLE